MAVLARYVFLIVYITLFFAADVSRSVPHNGADLTKESEIMLWTILVILVILWLLGFIGHFGGNLIHILIVVAVIILIYNLVAGRRSV